jgi:hypothetical protein
VRERVGSSAADVRSGTLKLEHHHFQRIEALATNLSFKSLVERRFEGALPKLHLYTGLFRARLPASVAERMPLGA